MCKHGVNVGSDPGVSCQHELLKQRGGGCQHSGAVSSCNATRDAVIASGNHSAKSDQQSRTFFFCFFFYSSIESSETSFGLETQIGICVLT